MTLRAPAALLAALALAVAGCAGSDPTTAGAALLERTGGTPVTGVLVDGDVDDLAATVRASSDVERPTVVNLFASWCEPCEREMPLLLDTARERDEITWVGVAHADARLPAEQWVERLGVDLPSLFDPDGTVAEAVGLRGMPTTLFFGSDGTLVAQHTGELTEDLLAGYLAELDG
ncbi:MAG: TlpA family protein disulfide reductase [Actinomycetes bacterium]